MALCNFLVDTSQTKPADPSSVMQSASKDTNTHNEYLGRPFMYLFIGISDISIGLKTSDNDL